MVLYIYIYSCNRIVYVLLSNIKYSVTHISTNWDDSTSSSTVCIILPIEVVINKLEIIGHSSQC